MSKNAAVDEYKMYEDLLEKRDKLAEKLQEQMAQLEQTLKKRIEIKKLHDNFKKSQKEQNLKYDEINIEGNQKINETKERYSKTIMRLKEEISRFQKPFEDEKANYLMAKQRLKFLRESGDMKREILRRKIMEVRYKTKITESKLVEVKNNVEKLKEFLMVNYPKRFDEYISNEKARDAYQWYL